MSHAEQKKRFHNERNSGVGFKFNALIALKIKFLEFIQSQSLSEKGVIRLEKWRSASASLIVPALMLALSLLFMASGCGNEERNVSTLGSPPSSAESGPEYIRSEKVSSYGRVETYTLSKEARAKESEKLSKIELHSLELSGNYGTTAYTLVGSDRPGAVLLAPRVFLQESVLGEHAQYQEVEGSETHLYLSLAITDGLRGELSTGLGTKKLPSELIIPNPSGLELELEQKLNRKPVFLSQVRCPKRLSISSPSLGEVDVAFKTDLKSCPLNTFFPAEIVFTRDQWSRFIRSLVQDEPIVVSSEFNLSMPLTIETAKYELKGSEVKSLMSSLVKGGTILSTAEVETILDGWVGAIQAAFDTHIESSQFVQAKDKIRWNFFLRRTGADCPAGTSPCFTFNSETTVRDFQFQMDVQEFYGKPLLLESASLVTDLTGDRYPLLLKAKTAESLLTAPASGEVNNLFQTVSEGEIMEFDFDSLRINNAQWAHPIEQMIDQWVCPSYGPPLTHEEPDFSNCLEHEKVCNQYMTCAPGGWAKQPIEWEADCCRSTGHGGESCGTRRQGNSNFPGNCTNVKEVRWRDFCAVPPAPGACEPGHLVDGPRCIRFGTHWVPNSGEPPCLTEKVNQWQKIISFSAPGVSSSWSKRRFQETDWKPLLPGLMIKFTSQDGSELTCSLSDFDPKTFGMGRMSLVLKNTDKCAPFNSSNRLAGHGPRISIVNQIAFPASFQCGQLWENYDGKRKYSCTLPDGSQSIKESTKKEDDLAQVRGEFVGVYQNYYPRVEIEGFMRIIGTYFNLGETK